MSNVSSISYFQYLLSSGMSYHTLEVFHYNKDKIDFKFSLNVFQKIDRFYFWKDYVTYVYLLEGQGTLLYVGNDHLVF